MVRFSLPGGGPVVPRTTSSVASSTWWESSAVPAAICSTVLSATRPISRRGWRIAVSGGDAIVASSVSSNPVTLTSSGMRRPRTRAASMIPSAMVSLPPTMAVGRAGRSSSSPPAARPTS